jgi:predicted thioesterase
VYNFRIAEVNVAQKSDSAFNYIAATLSSPTVPATPAFTTTAPVPNVTTGNVALTWAAIAPVAGTTMSYNVNITVNGITTTVRTNRTTYNFRPTAAQVGAGGTFSFTVQAVQTATVAPGATLFGSATSLPSAPASVTLTPSVAPAALAGVTATVASATTATLAWTDNTTIETSYLVTILNTTTGVTTTATVNRTAAQTTGTNTAVAYTAAVVAGNSYKFSVAAQNTKYGVTLASAAVSTTLAVPLAPTVPATPSVTSTATGVTVSWGTAVAGATNYTVQYSTNGGTTWTNVGTGAAGVRMAALTGASTSAAVTGLAGNTSYVFHVLATNAVGSSAYSATSAAQLTAPVVPTRPTAANGTAGGAITGGLSWTAPAGGATSYIVSWTGPAAGSTTVTAPAVTTGQLTFATAGTYAMTVTAVNATGNSPATAAVNVTVR